MRNVNIRAIAHHHISTLALTSHRDSILVLLFWSIHSLSLASWPYTNDRTNKKGFYSLNVNFAFEFVFSFSLFIPPNDMLKWAFESKLFAMILKFLFFFALNVLRYVARARWCGELADGDDVWSDFCVIVSSLRTAPHTTILWIDIQMGF